MAKTDWAAVHQQFNEVALDLKSTQNRPALSALDQVDRELAVRALRTKQRRLRAKLMTEPVDFDYWLRKAVLRKWQLLYLALEIDPRWAPPKKKDAAVEIDDSGNRLGDLPVHPRVFAAMKTEHFRVTLDRIDEAIRTRDIPPVFDRSKDYRPRFAFEYLRGQGFELPKAIVEWLDRTAQKGERPSNDEQSSVVATKPAGNARRLGRPRISDDLKDVVRAAARKVIESYPAERLSKHPATSIIRHTEFRQSAFPAVSLTADQASDDAQFLHATGISRRTVLDLIRDEINVRSAISLAGVQKKGDAV